MARTVPPHLTVSGMEPSYLVVTRSPSARDSFLEGTNSSFETL